MPDKERVADAVVLLLRGDDDKPCSVLESRNDDVLVSFRSETTLPLLPLRRCCPPRRGLFSARCEALEGDADRCLRRGEEARAICLK